MALNRREFASLTAASAFLPRAWAQKASRYFVFTGSYTGPKSKGIHVWLFSPSTGKVEPAGVAAETPNPSFLAVHPNRRWVFAANEVGNFGGQRSGSVSAFRLDAKTGKLEAINSVATKGGGPCYVSLDPSGKYVLVANYGGGSIAALPISEDGRLGEASAFVQHTGSSTNPKRQREPHAHCIKPSPDGKYVLAADLGIDQVVIYDFAGGALKPHGSLKLKPGAGPRHFAFHPNGRLLYVINELDSTITAATWKNGSAEAIGSVSTLPGGFSGENWTAEIVVHPNGRVLYGSNRGHNSIAVYDLDGSGSPKLRTHVPTQGETPRNFALDPTGAFVFAANQKSENVQLFRVGKDGGLTHTGESFEIGSPVCVRFAPAG